MDSKSHFRVRPQWSTRVKSTIIDGCNHARGGAPIHIPGPPSDNSATSEDENSADGLRVKTRGTLSSRERLTMQQKLKAVQHFEKNRMSQKDLREWMYKTLMLKKRPSKSAVANMFRPKDLARIKSFHDQTNPHRLQQKSSKQSHFPELEE